MKNFTLVLMLLYCCFGFSQLAEECFEGTWIPVPAISGTSDDWLVLDNGVGLNFSWIQQAHNDATPSSEGLPGTHSAYIDNENVSSGSFAEDFLITPEFTMPAGGVLTFQSKLSTAGVQGSIYRVYILPEGADAADIENYILIQEWTESQIAINPIMVWEEKVLNFSTMYDGQAVRVAFSMTGDNFDRWQLDCVKVLVPCDAVENLTAFDIGLDTAKLNWDNPGGASSWEIEILPEGGVPTGSGIVYSGSLPYLATETSVGVDFLPGTGYKYLVKALCSDGGESAWIGAYLFDTVGLGETCNAPIPITTLPYMDVDNTANFANNYNDSGSGCNTPGFDNSMIGSDVVYSFTPSFTGLVSFVMSNNVQYSTIALYDECNDIGFNCLDGGVAYPGSLAISFQEQVTAGEDYYIVISTAIGSTTDYTLVVQQAFCDVPVGQPATNIGMTSAEISWTDAGATSWEVVVQNLDDGIPTGEGITTTDNTNYNITEEYDGTALVAGTAYEYWVRADCNDGTFSAWAGPYAFNTQLCNVDEQCTYTFNMWSSNFGQWGSHTMNVVQNGVVVTELTGPSWGMEQVQVQLCQGFPFYLEWNSSPDAGMNVGISFTNGFDQLVYVKNPGEGSPNTILYETAALDCFTPLCMPTTGLYAENMTMATVDLGWDGPDTGTWEYYLVEAGQPAPVTTASGVIVTTNPAIGVAVEPATEYEYYVRVVCEDAATPTSQWTGPFFFSSSVCDLANKCEYRFIMKSINDFGGYSGGTITVSQNDITVAILGPEFTSGESMEVPIMICDDEPLEIFWTNAGNNPQWMGLEVFNSFNQPVYELPFDSVLNVGTMLYEGNNDCDAPACLSPTYLYAEDVLQTTASLGWSGPETGEWEYYIVEAGTAAPTATTDGYTTTVNPVSVDSLNEATEYEYYVRMICQNTIATDWAGPFSFSTASCPAENKCDFTFILGSAWWAGYSGGGYMTISQNGITVQVIGSDFTAGNIMEVTVPLCNDLPFEVFWDNGGDWAGQMGLDIVNVHGQTIFSLPVDNPGEGVGTFIFEGVVDCENVDCLPPTELYVENETTDSADLGWDGPATGNWEYYIVESGEPAPTSTTIGTMTTTNPAVNVPLANAFTYYDYYVRSHCENASTDESTWVGPYQFYTEVCSPESMCPFNFAMTSLNGSGNWGATFTLYQNGIELGTYPSNIYWWGASYSEEILLCPNAELQIVWTDGGFQPLEKSLTISSAFEEIFSMEYAEFKPGDTIFTGMVSCDEPICYKPLNVSVTEVGLSTAKFTWEEAGDATEWGVWVLPLNSEEPTSSTPPTFITTENSLIYGDDAGEVLLPGTPYEIYVIALCGEIDGNSLVSGPAPFATELTNDECIGAIEVPVNPDVDCVEKVYGTLAGSTLSVVESSCGEFYTQTDVWYKFIATAEDLALHVTNIANLDYENALFLSIFEGDCDGGLTEMQCAAAGLTFNRDFIVGNTYYLRLSGAITAYESIISSFEICISTPEPVIRVSDDEYTSEELVAQIFANTGCVNITNVTSSTGSDLGYENSNGIGYFNRNGSGFAFEEGIVISTGDIRKAPGRADQYGTGVGYNTDWPGTDDDLVEVFNLDSEQMHSPSIIEFDFQPVADSIKLNFIYASDEYVWCQSSAADKFAILLSGPGVSEQINIALVPGLDLPISPTTLRGDRQTTSGFCEGVNEAYFGNYNDENYGWTLDEDINYVGQTIPIEASASVVPGQTYHLKIVVADYNQGGYDSAIFLEGGSLDIGDIDLGSDYIQADGTALCSGESVALTPNLSAEEYTFEWIINNEIITGETGPSLVISENDFDFTSGPVTFAVRALNTETNCLREDSILVEYISMLFETPENLVACVDLEGNAEFDLGYNTAVLLGGFAEDIRDDYTVKYYATEEDREGNSNELPSPYTISDSEPGDVVTIYVGVTHTSGCVGEAEFTISAVGAAVDIAITEPFSLCAGTTGTITAEITPTGSDVTFSWTKDDEPIADTDAQIDVAEPGEYKVTVNKDGCHKTVSTIVDVIPAPVVQQTANVFECTQYELPALQEGNYFTQPNGGGVLLTEGDVITSTQVIYIYAESGTEPNCTAETSFFVTIATPEINLGGPYVFCDYTDAIISVNAENFNLAEAAFAWKVNGVDSQETSSSIDATDFGNYEVTVTVNGCQTTKSIEVTENNNEIAVLINDECIDGIYTLTAADVNESFDSSEVVYSWTGPDGFTSALQSIAPVTTGTYNVKIVTDENCVGTAAFDVASTLCFIQRGISPNGDGDNDFFDLSELDVEKISIFNRYGMEVYDLKDYTNQWHGQADNGDELPTGTYFYMIQRISGEQITGWIYINREE